MVLISIIIIKSGLPACQPVRLTHGNKLNGPICKAIKIAYHAIRCVIITLLCVFAEIIIIARMARYRLKIT